MLVCHHVTRTNPISQYFAARRCGWQRRRRLEKVEIRATDGRRLPRFAESIRRVPGRLLSARFGAMFIFIIRAMDRQQFDVRGQAFA